MRGSFLGDLVAIARCAGLALIIALSVAAYGVHAQTAPDTGPQEIETAPVEIDGETYFVVRGARSFTAQERADEVKQNIIEAAEKVVGRGPVMIEKKTELGTEILADGVFVTFVTKADGQLEDLDPDLLSKVIAGEVSRAITAYREARTNTAIESGLIASIIWTGVFILSIVILVLTRNFIRARGEYRIQKIIRDFEESTGRLVDYESIISVQRTFFRGFFIFCLFIVCYLYASLVLREFAVTSWLAFLLIDTIAAPLVALGEAAILEIPDIITLVVILLIARYLFRVLRLFFANVDSGVIVLRGFEPDWIWPTHRIARFVLAIGVVIIAYPYVPGSGTQAFQGMTILLGVLVTLSSNAIAANLMAGLFVIYKRSVNIGDRIQVGDVIGNVEHVSLLDAQIRTLKNEMVSVPNTKLVSDVVTNFTRTKGTSGLLVHAVVGIGYDEAPEVVERLLLEAASQTPGVKTTPKPFVLKTTLGSHDVGYEINAYAKKGHDPVDIRSDLNGLILEKFNSAEVQIMTPFYVADPEDPKIAPTPANNVTA